MTPNFLGQECKCSGANQYVCTDMYCAENEDCVKNQNGSYDCVLKEESGI